MSKQLEITLNRSLIGRNEKQLKTAKTLGLKKINSSVVHSDSPSLRGMIKVVSHMITVKEI